MLIHPPSSLNVRRRFPFLADFDLAPFRLPPPPSDVAGEGGRLYLTEYACQGDSVDIRCARPGDVIRVVRANYGRFSVAICNEEGRTDFSVNCLAPNSFSVMQNRSGRQTLDL